eukprot:1188590-Prorocentrum_minimum.AAC.1
MATYEPTDSFRTKAVFHSRVLLFGQQRNHFWALEARPQVDVPTRLGPNFLTTILVYIPFERRRRPCLFITIPCPAARRTNGQRARRRHAASKRNWGRDAFSSVEFN